MCKLSKSLIDNGLIGISTIDSRRVHKSCDDRTSKWRVDNVSVGDVVDVEVVVGGICCFCCFKGSSENEDGRIVGGTKKRRHLPIWLEHFVHGQLECNALFQKAIGTTDAVEGSDDLNVVIMNRLFIAIIKDIVVIT